MATIISTWQGKSNKLFGGEPNILLILGFNAVSAIKQFRKLFWKSKSVIGKWFFFCHIEFRNVAYFVRPGPNLAFLSYNNLPSVSHKHNDHNQYFRAVAWLRNSLNDVGRKAKFIQNAKCGYYMHIQYQYD